MTDSLISNIAYPLLNSFVQSWLCTIYGKIYHVSRFFFFCLIELRQIFVHSTMVNLINLCTWLILLLWLRKRFHIIPSLLMLFPFICFSTCYIIWLPLLTFGQNSTHRDSSLHSFLLWTILTILPLYKILHKTSYTTI